MKKFLNKLSNSGNLREESTYDKEHMDTHFRKPTTLAQDTKDTSEEIKLRKSYSLSKATSPRFRESMDSDEFSKKKSSTGMKKEGKEGKDNEKLHESDDKALRKSFSLRGVFNKSSDQVKVETVRSPSIKNVFSSYDKVNRDPAEMDNSDSDEDQDAFVPHKFDDDEQLASAPIRVPSAPGRMTSSPPPLSPTRASPSSPPMHLSTSSVRSPSSNNTLHFTPTSPTSLSSSSPIVVPSSPPSVAIPAFTQSPPSNAQVPKIVAVDEFDSHFNFNNDKNNNDIFRGRTDSITDDYGSEFGRIHRADSQVDGASEGDEIMDDDEEESIHVKKGGRFGFGLNKSRKLKA